MEILYRLNKKSILDCYGIAIALDYFYVPIPFVSFVLLTFENQSVVDFNIVRFEILDRVKGRGGDS